MASSAVSLKTKLTGGFLGVILLFGAVLGYQVYKMNWLAELEEEQGGRARDAVEVQRIALDFEAIYASIADAIINRNLSGAASDFATARRHMVEDAATVRKMVDTPAEKAAAEEFATQYSRYLDAIDNKLMPVLRSGKADPAEVSRIDDELDGIRDTAKEKLALISKSLGAEMDESAKLYDEGRKTAINVLIYSSIFISVAAIVIALLITKSITTVVGGEPALIASVAEKIARGDLTKSAGDGDAAHATGILKSVLAMGESLRALIIPMSESMRNMAASSDQLASVASQMRRSTSDSSERAGAVAAAAEEMQANMTSVASAVEETTTNVASVATAAEELTATIGEIAQRAAEARARSEGAVGTAQSLNTVIGNLSQSAEQIGRVTETIADISEQTKLLALNATIEAARAGEAGKGFAVVASEIKELARQVATATGDITTRVDSIREATKSTRDGMTGVEGAINEVNQMVMTIASAVEEQAITVREISRNAQEVSTAAHESAMLVAQTSEAGGMVARDVAGLKVENDKIAAGSTELDQSSGQLKTISGQMREVVGRFKLE